MLNIDNAVAVITGGASGIGLATAQYWRRNGGKVVIGEVAEEALANAAGEIGGPVKTVVCDFTREADCARLADTAIEAFGAINLVAPFAGIIKDGLMLSTSRETGKVAKKMALEDFQKVIDIN
jgi:3-oxoacyl-[acyl-carrier protein] reductase